jgi:hypothetical protein
MVATIACGRIGFEAGAALDATHSDDPDSGGTANACATVDNTPPAPTFDCAPVENAIRAGTIASISDSDLIAWAQNGCMRKPAPAALAAMAPSAMFPIIAGTGPDCSSGAPPGSDGTGPNYIYAGSGTLELGSFTGTCGDTNLHGTYERIHFTAISTSAAVNTHYDGCRAVHVGRLGAAATLRAYDYAAAAASPFPTQFRVSSIENTARAFGGTGPDEIVVTGDAAGSLIETLAGDDTVVVGGRLVQDDSVDTFLRLGDGNDTAYLKDIGVVGASPESDVYAGAGNDRIYFNAFRVEDIFGDSGDDILSCTGLFGIAGCTSYGEWGFLEGNEGNDIISVDGPLIQTQVTSGATTVSGGSGFNIIYLQSISNISNNRGLDIDVTTTGSSLLIIGGDHETSMNTTVTAAGANNVLLVRAGATNLGFTFTGFARTLTY